MAHRLWLTEGKCEAIHGHSYDITLEIGGEVDDNGLLGGLEFAEVKRLFRHYIDHQFDHHLLLNSDDPVYDLLSTARYVPGVNSFDGADPTTENLAKNLGEWARNEFGLRYQYRVIVWETAVNCATWEG